jgi:hypothetical protein
MHVKGNKGNRGCPRINKEPTSREKKNKIKKHFPDHRDPPPPLSLFLSRIIIRCGREKKKGGGDNN